MMIAIANICRLSFISWGILFRLMRKKLATLRAIIAGNATIEYINKTPVKKAPGETTEVAHQ
jgi:hypothetical protein